LIISNKKFVTYRRTFSPSDFSPQYAVSVVSGKIDFRVAYAAI